MKLMLADSNAEIENITSTADAILKSPNFANIVTTANNYYDNLSSRTKTQKRSRILNSIYNDLKVGFGINLPGPSLDHTIILTKIMPNVIIDTYNRFRASGISNNQKEDLGLYLYYQYGIFIAALNSMKQLVERNKKQQQDETEFDNTGTETTPDKETDEETTIKKWYENPTYLIAAGAAAFFLLPKLLKR
jgi:hypothetical protein